MNDQKSRELKICFLGAASVGKSSIMERFTQNDFNKIIEPTLGAAYMPKTFEHNNI